MPVGVMLRAMIDSGDTQPLPVLHPPSPAAPTIASPRPAASTRTSRRRARRWLVATFLTALVLAGGVIFGTAALVIMQARTDEARPVDAIVVMGAAQYNGRPSPVFAARLEHALALYQQGMAPTIVVTGGKQPGDAYTEAEAAQAWLLERGVPAEAIRMENAGRSTAASIEAVPEVVPPEGASVLVVSDGFHLFRSELMFRDLGYAAYSSPAPDSPIRPWSPQELAYVVRETGGVLAFLPEMWFG
jgi:vancomycin permeability regulator SanA